MPNNDLLAQLRPSHLPEPIGWWPLAPGWWILIAMALVASATLLWFYRYRAKQRYRKLAKHELDQFLLELNDPKHFAAATSILLKRVARYRYGAAVSNLHSQAWQLFLTERAPDCDDDVFAAICVGQYKPEFAMARESIYQQAAHWLRRHR